MEWSKIRPKKESKKKTRKNHTLTKRKSIARRNRLIKDVHNPPFRVKGFVTLIVPGGVDISDAPWIHTKIMNLFKIMLKEFEKPTFGYKIENKDRNSPNYSDEHDNVGVHVHLWGSFNTAIKRQEIEDWFFRKWSKQVGTTDRRAVDVRKFDKKFHPGYLTKNIKKDDDEKVMEALYPYYSFGSVGTRRKDCKKPSPDFDEICEEAWQQVVEPILQRKLYEQAEHRKGRINPRQKSVISKENGFMLLDEETMKEIQKELKKYYKAKNDK